MKRILIVTLVAATFGSGYWLGTQKHLLNHQGAHHRQSLNSTPASHSLFTTTNAAKHQQVTPGSSNEQKLTREATLAAIQNLEARKPSPLRDQEQWELIIQLAATDPILALKMAAMQSEDTKNYLTSNIVKKWAALDPQGAMNWLESTNQDPSQTYYYDSALEVIAQNNPDLAIDYAEKLANAFPEQSSGIFNTIVNGMSAAGEFESVRTLLKELPLDADTRAGLVNSAATVWAKYNAQDAANWVLELPESEQLLPIGGLASAWASHNPSAAVQFASQIGNDENRAHYLKYAVPTWIMKDPEAAKQWLSNQDSYNDYDEAILDAVNESQLTFKNPKLAAQLFGNIRDKNQLVQGLNSLMLGYKSSGMEQDGIAYLNTISGLNDQQKQQLLQLLE